MQSIEITIKNRIYGMGRGSCFTPDRFLDLGGDESVRQSLSRLTKQGVIRRLSKGLYEYPRVHKVLGVLPPETDKVVKALIARDDITIQPSGAYAANLLGLSEQVPAKIVYLTDGNSKKIKIGKQEIVFKKTLGKVMAVAGTKSGLVIQALLYLGKDHLTEVIKSRLSRRLSTKEKSQLLNALKYAPIWMRNFLREVYSGTKN